LLKIKAYKKGKENPFIFIFIQIFNISSSPFSREFIAPFQSFKTFNCKNNRLPIMTNNEEFPLSPPTQRGFLNFSMQAQPGHLWFTPGDDYEYFQNEVCILCRFDSELCDFRRTFNFGPICSWPLN